jgi:hypothetical protein
MRPSGTRENKQTTNHKIEIFEKSYVCNLHASYN